ncbi:MAG: tetratricopeptide repeat protein [Phaeodactylibacter sp.]|nr:tetratricopeptide repeat protein [Phaeodactylibacter sp.]MCB9299220.1 tetratricopeptide repeat protein [Lewinellaceae bacterium]
MAEQGNTAVNEQMPDLEKDGVRLHLGIAEQGKVYALQGRHKMALLYYQTAIGMTVEAGDPEIFFRAYLESALESMEHTGMYDEVLDYCNQALELYEKTPPPNEFARFDFAHIHQKKGIILFKLGRKEEAKEYLQKAIQLIRAEKRQFPLADKMLRWIQMGYHLDAQRILEEQYRLNYFAVTPKTVQPQNAIKLPNEPQIGE